MKIVFIISGLETGGAENMLFKLLAGLDRTRFESMVVSLTGMGEYGPRIQALGIPVIALEMRAASNAFLAFPRLLKLLWDSRPTLVHTWLYHADLMGGLAARAAGVRHVCWGIRNSNLNEDSLGRSVKWSRLLCAKLSRQVPTRIVLNSEAARLCHTQLGYDGTRMTVLPNGFDVSRFKPDAQSRSMIRAELGIPKGATVVGLVSRWDPVKNISGFMAVARQVVEHNPDVHVVLAGKGLDMHNAELASAVPRAADTRYHLLGPRTDIPAVMSSLDIFVLPSHGEGFPNALGEAMATGLACTVTDVGDCAEILGSAGQVVPRGDMQGLAQATMALMNLSEPERAKLGSLARARIASSYALDAVVRQHEDFYCEVAGLPAISGGH